MKVTESKCVQGFIRMCTDGWDLGWHERNGGNLSYRMKAEEIAEIESALAAPSIYAKDNARAVALTARLPVARAELDAAATRWLELSERA